MILGCKGLTELSFISLLLTMSKLELPLGDMKMMAMEIEEYHTFLAQMSTFLLLSLAYGFCFSAMHRYPRNIKQWLTRNERTLNLQMLNSLCKIHA